MTNPKGTAAHESHHVATADKESTHSPSDNKLDRSGQDIEESALEKLLETDEKFYWTMMRELADTLVRRKVPPFLIEDLVQDAWLSAVQHCDLFIGGNAKQRLRGFLRKVVLDKAVDLCRHLHSYPCQSFDGQEMKLSDETESRRAEMAELREHLETLLAEAGRGNEKTVSLVRAHFFEGYSIQELAQRWSLTVKTVEGCIRRLMEKIGD